jgi:hypothetical protein
LHQINLWDPRLKGLSALAARIAAVVERSKAKEDDSVVAVLDDLLGAVYALVSAVENDFKGKTGKSDFDAVLTRAQQLAKGQVRKDGNWMAGFHFNNALFRISAVFDRLPKAVRGHDAATKAYLKRKGHTWQNKEAQDIRNEVNDIKHKASGVFRRRRRVLEDATRAVEQLLDLAETLPFDRLHTHDAGRGGARASASAPGLPRPISDEA